MGGGTVSWRDTAHAAQHSSIPAMKIDLFKGLIRDASDSDVVAWCARTPFGIRAVALDCRDEILAVEPEHTSVSEHVTTLDLPGLDREALEFLMDTILQQGYLARPGVRDKGDAVLFILTNDALRSLDQAALWEAKEAEETSAQ
jgi:hypothetical protein